MWCILYIHIRIYYIPLPEQLRSRRWWKQQENSLVRTPSFSDRKSIYECVRGDGYVPVRAGVGVSGVAVLTKAPGRTRAAAAEKRRKPSRGQPHRFFFMRPFAATRHPPLVPLRRRVKFGGEKTSATNLCRPSRSSFSFPRLLYSAPDQSNHTHTRTHSIEPFLGHPRTVPDQLYLFYGLFNACTHRRRCVPRATFFSRQRFRVPGHTKCIYIWIREIQTVSNSACLYFIRHFISFSFPNYFKTDVKKKEKN